MPCLQQMSDLKYCLSYVIVRKMLYYVDTEVALLLDRWMTVMNEQCNLEDS